MDDTARTIDFLLSARIFVDTGLSKSKGILKQNCQLDLSAVLQSLENQASFSMALVHSVLVFNFYAFQKG